MLHHMVRRMLHPTHGGGSWSPLQGPSTHGEPLQESSERSYHCFYQLCAGAGHDERAALRLRADEVAAGATARSFRTLCCGDCVALRSIDDASAFAETREALGGLCAALRATPHATPHATASPHATAPRESAALASWAEEGQGAVWACVAACLHLGNVTFTPGPLSGGKAVAVLQEPARASLQAAAALWQVDEAALHRALTTRTIAAGSELCELQKSDVEAATSRDALAKAAYERLFDALILLVNASLAGASSAANMPAAAPARHPPPASRGNSGGGNPAGGGDGGGGFIGLLDIFGNEVFGVNSYEQLLINFANEKLQQHFVATAISHVQSVYEAEGLPFSKIEVVDNGAVLSLLEGKPVSLLALLDDLCLYAGASDADFVGAVHARFEGHAAFAPPSFDAQTRFTVRHFAGEVTYRGAGFIAKNKALYT